MTFYPNVGVDPDSKMCLDLKAIRRAMSSRNNPKGRPATIPAVDLLGSSTKVAHSLREGWENTVMYLAPAKVAGGSSMCIWAGDCQLGCLATSGQLGMGPAQRAIIMKTLGYKADQDLFMQLLVMNVVKFANGLPTKEKAYKKKGTLPKSATLKACVRFNGTSDVAWELIPVTITPELMASIRIGPKTNAYKYIDKRIKAGKTYRNIYEIFPKMQFYDYTKAPIQVRQKAFHNKYGNKPWPKNYNLTFSLDEKASAPKHAKWALDHGHSVACVFNTDVKGVALWSGKTKEDKARIKKLRAAGKKPKPYDIIPKTMYIPEVGEYEVINADFTDLRFKDGVDKRGRGKIAWLSAKGDAMGDTTGFIRDFRTGEKVTDPSQWMKYAEHGHKIPIKRKGSRSASTIQYPSWDAALITGFKYKKDGKTRTKTAIIPWKKVAAYVSGGGCMRLPTMSQTKLDVKQDSPKLPKIDNFSLMVALQQGAEAFGIRLAPRDNEIWASKRGSSVECPPPEGRKEAGSLIPKRNPGMSYYRMEDGTIYDGKAYKRLWPGGKLPSPAQRKMLGIEKISKAHYDKLQSIVDNSSKYFDTRPTWRFGDNLPDRRRHLRNPVIGRPSSEVSRLNENIRDAKRELRESTTAADRKIWRDELEALKYLLADAKKKNNPCGPNCSCKKCRSNPCCANPNLPVFKMTTTSGHSWTTPMAMSVTLAKAKKYFMNKKFNVASYPKEKMEKVVKVELLGTTPRSNPKQRGRKRNPKSNHDVSDISGYITSDLFYQFYNDFYGDETEFLSEASRQVGEHYPEADVDFELDPYSDSIWVDDNDAHPEVKNVEKILTDWLFSLHKKNNPGRSRRNASQQDFNAEDEMVDLIDGLRKANKGKWYSFSDGSVKIKGFGTWLQVFTINGVNYSNAMEQSVKDFKAHIRKSAKQAMTKRFNPNRSKSVVHRKRSGKLTTRRKGATTMATRKQIAAARRNIKKAQAANRKKRRKPAAKKKSTAKRKKCAPKAPKGKPKGTHFKRKNRWYVVGPNRTVRKSSASAANKAKLRNRKRGAKKAAAKRRRR
jgi:hypothetical protein